MKVDINGIQVDLQKGDRMVSSWIAISKGLYIQVWRQNPKKPELWDILAYEHSEKL
jgi:hypothetical protein